MNATPKQEVIVTDDRLARVDSVQIATLKTLATGTARHRARLCAHKSEQDRLHDMLIVLARNVYIRPHKHLNKVESFHVIEGRATVVFFDEASKVADVVRVGDYASGLPFFFRNDDDRYHTQLVESDFLVFHETTTGPFNREDTKFAPWSPDESDGVAVQAFVEKLRRKVGI